MNFKIIGLATVSMVLLLACRPPLQMLAMPSPAQGSTGIDYDDGTLFVEAGEPGSLRIVDRPGVVTIGRRVRCGWYAIGGSGNYPTWDPSSSVVPEIDEVYLLRCFHPDDNSDLSGYPRIVRYEEREEIDGPAVSIVEIEKFAVDSIAFETPVPVLSPPEGQIVGVDTWLGVDSQLSYRDVSAQAGDTWATARPVLRYAEWTFADGEFVRCSVDIDKLWDPGLGLGSQSTRCSHVFEHVSGPEGYPTEVKVSWTIYERTNIHPNTWTIWGVVSRSMSLSIVVDELQSVIR